MFGSVVAALALAASVSQVAATPINHVARGYRQDADILEDYTPYHVRYLALKCQEKHNSEFFEQCCHPLLRWQKLEDRPAQCTPSASASSSAALAEPTAPAIDEDPVYDDDDCEGVSSSPAPAAATTSYVAPEPTTYAQATTSYEPEPTSSAKPKAKAQTTEEPQTTSYKPETTSYEEPQHTTSYEEPKPTTSAEPKPTTSAAPSGGNDGAFTGGFATYFLQNGVAGACGKVHGEYDLIVAADYRRYGDLSKQSDLCGKSVVITNTKNGKTVTAVVADACPTCTNNNSLDLSKGAFEAIASLDDGMVPISWYIQ